MRKTPCKPFWICLLVAALTCGPLLAEQTPSKIIMAGGSSSLEGQVLDAAGDGLAGLTLIISVLDGSTEARSAITNEKGEYLVEGLPYGYYRVSFEYGGQAYPANRVLLLSPGKTLEADFVLGAIEPTDESLGIVAGKPGPLVGQPIGGIARLVESTGPSGLAWFRTGKGVATLVGGGTLIVAGLIALTSTTDDEPVVSSSSP